MTTPALVDIFTAVLAEIPGTVKGTTSSINLPTNNKDMNQSVNTFVTTATAGGATMQNFYVNNQLSVLTSAAPADGSVVQSWFSPKIAVGAFKYVNCIG